MLLAACGDDASTGADAALGLDVAALSDGPAADAAVVDASSADTALADASAEDTALADASLPSQCPRASPSCPSGVTTQLPTTIRFACTAIDLANLRVACADGPGAATCQQQASFLGATKPACFSCIRPFLVEFADRRVFTCVAPYVNPQCNGYTGCAIDCQTRSCDQCSSGQLAQCLSDVRQGQCGGAFIRTQCIIAALSGLASFCNPDNYSNMYGGWLEGVGRHYCGP